MNRRLYAIHKWLKEYEPEVAILAFIGFFIMLVWILNTVQGWACFSPP